MGFFSSPFVILSATVYAPLDYLLESQLKIQNLELEL